MLRICCHQDARLEQVWVAEPRLFGFSIKGYVLEGQNVNKVIGVDTRSRGVTNDAYDSRDWRQRMKLPQSLSSRPS